MTAREAMARGRGASGGAPGLDAIGGDHAVAPRAARSAGPGDRGAGGEPALTLPAATPLAESARRMLQTGAHAALVVEDGRLVGILTHSDLLRALVPQQPETVA